MAIETKKATCGFCQGGCQILVDIEDDRIIKVAPDTDSPKGRLCPRGALVPKFLYGKQRLTKPLIRSGERGEGKFREASWDEALDYAARLIKKVADDYGPQALASYFGRGVLFNPVMALSMGPEAFLAHLGSPNDSNCSSICNTASSTIAPKLCLGVGTMQQIQDIPNSDLIISWGKNPTTDEGPQPVIKQIKEAQGRGAKLIVIDPRKKGIGEIADWWIPIIPGTDGALALALCKIIIEEDRYDHNFVNDWVLGFDEFRNHLAELELQNLSCTCGISVNDIRKIADMFCSTQRASLVSYTGLEYAYSAVQNIRAQYVLWAITGKLDCEGSIYLNARNVETPELAPIPKEPLPLGFERFELFCRMLKAPQFACFPKAVLENDPYPVRGLVVCGGSPALSFPDNNKWREAYKALDCLIVVDRFYSEEARYADVVFPATTLYESIRTQATPDGPILHDPVVKPYGDSKHEVVIFGLIADRLGFGEDYPQSNDELCEWLVAKPSRPYVPPLTIPKPLPRKYKKYETGELRADGKPGFPTPSGKFEICSDVLASYGFSPFPKYTDAREVTGFSTEDWPLIMTTGARSNKRMGGLGANLEGIGDGIDPKPFVEINPEDARVMGVNDGDETIVTTPFGSARFFAKVCEVAKGAIHVPHGGGSTYMPKAWQQGAVNELTSLDEFDPITGFVAFKSVPCKVEPAL